MSSRNVFLIAILAFAWAAPAAADTVAIRAGKVLTMDAKATVVNNAVILVKDGKIEAVGPAREVEIPEGCRIIEAARRWVLPGLVEGHNHALGSLQDLNDNVWLTNPGLRALDATTPGNDAMLQSLAGGVTTALVIPGSGSNMGGLGLIAKNTGENIDKAILRQPGTLKVAQAGNPEWYFGGVGRSYMNYNLRQTLEKAKAYAEKWRAFEEGETSEKPEFDPVWEPLRGFIEGKYPASVHTQIYQVFLKTITMFHDEFGFDAIPFHSTFDSFKAAPMVAARDMHVCNGPRQIYFDRTQRAIFGHCQRWWQGGVRSLSVNTDSTGAMGYGVSQVELAYQATMAARMGLPTYPALEAITIDPAEGFKIADRVGSIEVGKDADFSVWTGNPIDPRSSCEMTLVDGKVVYDASKVRRRQF